MIKHHSNREQTVIKSVHFGDVHSERFAPVSTRVHGKVLSFGLPRNSSFRAIDSFHQMLNLLQMCFTKSCDH